MLKHTPLVKHTPESQCVPTAWPAHDCAAVLVVVVPVVVLPVNIVVALVLLLTVDADVDVDDASTHTPALHAPDSPETAHDVPSPIIGPAKQLPSKQTPES